MFGFQKLLGVALAVMLAVPAFAVELVMVEQEGCVYCEQWDADIAPAYPKTSEGRFAPLRRVDLFNMPEDLELLRRVNYTPTFLLVEDNKEIGRLEGYPGPDFFWPLLDRMLKKLSDYKDVSG